MFVFVDACIESLSGVPATFGVTVRHREVSVPSAKFWVGRRKEVDFLTVNFIPSEPCPHSPQLHEISILQPPKKERSISLSSLGGDSR